MTCYYDVLAMDFLEINKLVLIERQKYAKSDQKSDKGRYYVFDQISKIMEEFKDGFENERIKQLLRTIEKIKISEEKCLKDFLPKDALQMTPEQVSVFRLPVFPITFNAEENPEDEDILIKIYKDLFDAKDEWLMIFDKQDPENAAMIFNWKKRLLDNKTFNCSSFFKQNMCFSNRCISSADPYYLEARIQEYTSRANLSHDALVPVFRFICNSGGDVSDLLLDILYKEFKNLKQSGKICNRRVNWSYDDQKNIVCCSKIGACLEEQDTTDVQDQAHHDPRAFSMTWDENQPLPDLIIKTQMNLTWYNSHIVLNVSDIVIGGRLAKERFVEH